MGILVNPFRFGGTSVTDAFIASSESTLNASTYTFSTHDIGTANASRVVVVGVCVYDSSSTNGISSVTIGGSAATEIVNTTSGGDLGTCLVTGLYRRSVAAGTTADIVVNTSNAAQSCGIAVWALYPSSATPTGSDSSALTNVGSITASPLSITSGGTLVAVSFHNNSTNVTWNYTGTDTVSEEFDEALGDSGINWTAATVFLSQTATVDLQADHASGTVNASIAAAAWGA
jgi:hypothetical protein